MKLAAVMIVLMLPEISFGWGDGGHMAVAMRAWDELDSRTRESAIRLLKLHPRYATDFSPKMPAGLSAEDQDLWLFTFAATWPDYVWKIKFTSARDFQKYFHASRHVIAEPVALDSKMQTAMPGIKSSSNSSPSSLTIRDALPVVTRELSDTSLSAGDRAVALCWVLHLTGDLHEPCHSASLFCRRFKAPGGDHVATLIPVIAGQQKCGLHQYWDSLYCNSTDLDVLKKWDLNQRSSPNLQRTALAELTSHPGVDDWVAESFVIAKASVYDPEVRASIAMQDTDLSATFRPIVLSEKYMARAREIARKRGVLAGLRLADTLKKVQW